MTVTVNRGEAAAARTSTRVLKTGSRGAWTTSYGFTFVPNQDETFFTKEEGEASFRITPLADRSTLSFVPGVFFSWLPSSRADRDFAISLTAGLGFDTSNPVVFLGPSLSFNRNVTLTAGVVVHQQVRLNGRYADGDTVSENLGPEQLEVKTFRPNAFVGVTFRFDANPFE